MAANRLQELDDRLEDLHDLMRLRKHGIAEFDRLYELGWIHHDNALEGIVLSAPEMQAALHPAMLAPSDTSTTILYTEVRNHKAAIDFIRAEAQNKKSAINMTLVKRLYEILGTGFEGRDKANFRKDMPLHRTYFHDIAQPAKIQPMLEKVLEMTTTAEFKEGHPIKQASRLHHGFMQVFPFTDNSGKVARLLSNLILIRAGMLPAIIHAIDRQRYYESLKQPATSLMAIYIEAVDNSLENAQKYFESVPRKGKAAS
ncbi:MAG: Fic family protein [Deltaproteobacteria bacterium]|nr:Fic family protein [Deltaproteobacteria bacterium]